ncbi:murein hydrolase activator EnvC family protein [Puniceibacterium sediminis]|uniref:Septal ring factor EnvC, activator of murein hydrolases AmiA and AmiB n=1 Tax=Puniceibacterium sediminis TaxID=1608407 RepID=A0A238VFP7_9RHOB|nr:peptidoglycan DD-metalloendopeptidase family protein [Puniceibacterium sediminis]SNR32998.1 Septal ring factor EnvC, activator of murein hydrolases AmiA and AmiB [Puniceibacterium sediminis]
MMRAALFLLLFATPLAAQTGPADAARAAADQLEEASRQLDRADGVRDRIKALTDVVRAYEAGLSAMRDGLRGAAIRETELRRDLRGREDEVAGLLGILQGIGGSAAPETLMHPGGPLATARAGMLLAGVTPGLAARATSLRGELEEVTTLRQLQADAIKTLQEGLAGVQRARTELSQAMDSRTDLPMRFTEDPVRTAILIAATETLEGFASGLSNVTEEDSVSELPSIESRMGTLPMPVSGKILRRAGEADAAGVERPGIVVATRPGALVTSPTAATIRYRGPLLDYGLVTILEPQADLLFVLAGLDIVYGEIGEVLSAGAPVGLMGGTEAETGDMLSPIGERAGNARPETLYIEVRQGDTPVDPMTWFLTDKG